MVIELNSLQGKVLSKICVLAKFEIYKEEILKIFTNSNIEFRFFSSLEDLKANLNSEEVYDVIFVPHLSEIVPSSILKSNLVIGFHTGTLPKDRGGSPIQNKILNREYSTYVNAFIMTEEVDGGPLLASSEIDLASGNLLDLIRNIAEIVAVQILDICKNFPTPKIQASAPIRFERLSPKDSELPSEIKNLEDVYNRIRMVDGFNYPKCFLNYGNLRIEFNSAQFLQKDAILETKCEIRILNGN